MLKLLYSSLPKGALVLIDNQITTDSKAPLELKAIIFEINSFIIKDFISQIIQ